MIQDVTDLRVYNEALENLRLVYQLAKFIPQDHRKQRQQLIEAAEKLAPIIAEGFAKRRSHKEFLRFLEMALGSSDEVITHARQVRIIAENYKRIPTALCDQVITKYKGLSAGINKLRTNWIDYTRK